jgi:putative transposase
VESDKGILGAGGYDPAVHHRKSIRMRGHDYAGGGTYFVTACVAGRRPLFGTVAGGRMALNDAGRLAAACWRSIPEHFPQVALDEWVVMPDHVHGILRMRGDGAGGRAKDFSPVRGGAGRGEEGEKFFALTGGPRGTAGTLGSVVRGFKVGVTKGLGASPWLRNYYEIIVRDGRALESIRRYVRENPANWGGAQFGAPRYFAGNRGLLELPMTAFLASRGGGGDGGDGGGGRGGRDGRDGRGEKIFALTAGTGGTGGVVSGFLSPMEREVFEGCLGRGIPMVWILARGLPGRFAPRVQRAIDAGRLLAMTPFDAGGEGVSAARAAWCNQFALQLADGAVIGRLSPDGMLACLLADLPRDIPIRFLGEPQFR